MVTLTNRVITGRIYIALGSWYFGDFRNIFLPNIGEDQKKVLPSERRALCHMVNPKVASHHQRWGVGPEFPSC